LGCPAIQSEEIAMSLKRMSLKRRCGTLLAATLLAGFAGAAFAGPSGDKTQADKIPRQENPAIDSVPPTPNGGMSSGAHLGNESPTYPGNSATGKSKLNSPSETEGRGPRDEKPKADDVSGAQK
jgi:hypothetical protein